MTGELIAVGAIETVGKAGVPRVTAVIRGFCGPRCPQELPVEFFGREAVALLAGAAPEGDATESGGATGRGGAPAAEPEPDHTPPTEWHGGQAFTRYEG